jgi:hypothetical protein
MKYAENIGYVREMRIMGILCPKLQQVSVSGNSIFLLMLIPDADSKNTTFSITLTMTKTTAIILKV